MSITINLEIGHDASLRTKTTPEGFTHDWEVFVKGCNSAEIHYYVEKVVFHLHETFPKPKRVIKEPPYSLRTSGYAGFNLPIEIYLRNNQEPKKIRFNYDLQLQPTGPPLHRVQKEKYVFHSPSEEFRSKLLKGGGIVGSLGSTNDINDTKVTDEKIQMTSKSKVTGSDVAKKYRMKPEEPRNTDFLNLFGTPITKTTSKTPEVPKPKEVSKSSSKPDKLVEKDKTKTKSPHKDKEKEKTKDKDKSSDSSEKRKEEKKKSKEDKNRDRERSKEKSSKKDKEREKSPASRPRSPSPKRSPKRVVSPPPPSKHTSKDKDQSKEEKKEKERKEDKKNKKEKREHKDSKHKEKDRDKEKEHKEHKSRESKSSKESTVKEKDISPVPALPPVPTVVPVVSCQPPQKNEKKVKEKELTKEAKEEERPEKTRQEKSEDKQKHKHKKKDRKEKREEKYSKSEKKLEKPSSGTVVKEETKEPAAPVSSTRDIDKSNLFGSPKSDPPSTPNEEQKPEKPTNNSMSFKEDETSNDSNKVSSREPSPVPRAPSKSPSLPPAELAKKPEPEKKKEELTKKKEKKEKKKDKKADRDHEKRRKRKSPPTHIESEQPPEKVPKEKENNNSDDERKVSSTEDANPLPKNEAEDYMGMLRDLQHKIMGLKDNSDLQKVVQLIAETGRYEVSAHTFDFDLCLLDRSTVRQLQDFFSSIS